MYMKQFSPFHLKLWQRKRHDKSGKCAQQEFLVHRWLEASAVTKKKCHKIWHHRVLVTCEDYQKKRETKSDLADFAQKRPQSDFL